MRWGGLIEGLERMGGRMSEEGFIGAGGAMIIVIVRMGGWLGADPGSKESRVRPHRLEFDLVQ